MIYCGTIVTDEGKEKKVNIDFEPFRPINTSLYLCDNKFHTEVSYEIYSEVLFHVYDFQGIYQGMKSLNYSRTCYGPPPL